MKRRWPTPRSRPRWSPEPEASESGVTVRPGAVFPIKKLKKKLKKFKKLQRAALELNAPLRAHGGRRRQRAANPRA